MGWLKRFFLSDYKPSDQTAEDESDTGNYEGVSSVVYRRLDRVVSILGSDEEQRLSLAKLDRIEAWARALPRGDTRRAYLKWLPWFRASVRRYMDYNERSRRAKAAEPHVPRHPA
jgi:hypothetical protein